MEQAAPEGTEILVYLYEMYTSEELIERGLDMSENDAGHPAGQPLFGVFSPQGFYLGNEETGGVVQPQESALYSDASLEDFYPTADEFPKPDKDPGAELSFGRGSGS